ncbi:hypothetical protein Tco_1284033 [Tanacetum coccineum]
MRPRILLRLLSDFDCKIRYHSGKASVAADALSRNERAKPLMAENVKDENLYGMDKELRLVLIELPALGAGVGYHALWEHTMMRPDHQDPNALDNLKPWKKYCFHKFTMSFCYGKVATEKQSREIDDMLRIKLREAESNEEIFTSMAWIRAFNINQPIYVELCHEFYSTYEFDEVCVDDELQTMKIIKFRLGGRAHNLTLLEFACRLGLYHADELEEDGFDVYFQGGLRSDDNFNAQEYWLSISREENLGLSRSHTSTIRSPVLRVIHKMITYGLCQRTSGYEKIQKNDLWLQSMFDARHQNGYANVAWLIAKWMKRKGSDFIDSKGRLIPEDPHLGVPGVGIPRPPRASMQDLYDRMGRMEIRQEYIERMEYRQEPTTHMVILSHSMISIISSTHLHHHSIHRSISSSKMMMSSVETTQEIKKRKKKARDEMERAKDSSDSS